MESPSGAPGGAGGAPVLVLATANPDKADEMARLLAGLPFRLVGRDAFPDLAPVAETADSFAGNARLKAEATCAATGLPALGDDSGLCVDALDGAPGVRSARWAGPGCSYADNNEKLLAELKDVPDEDRTARFVCWVAVARPGRETVTFEGLCEGVIARAPKGKRGFGYDPLFRVPELGKTFAELAPEEKARISHRALAFASARAWLLCSLPDWG
jgi:XTP/dITP diphosphohydrolase